MKVTASPSPKQPLITHFLPELLTTIFALLSAELRANSTTARLPKGWVNTRMAWVPLMLVCRHWRNVGLSSPWLWRRISVTANLESLQYRLSRTAGCTIDLFFNRGAAVVQNAIPLLIPLARQIRSIQVNPYFSVDDLPSLTPLFRIPLPAVEYVRVIPCWWDGDTTNARRHKEGSWFDLGISEALHPRVRRFETHRIVMPTAPKFWSSMRKVTIKLHNLQTHPLRVEDVLNILSNAPLLESLAIPADSASWSYPSGSFDPATFRGTPPSCFLPCLRELHLQGPPPFIAPLLHTIEAPALVIFRVGVYVFPTMDSTRCVPLIVPKHLRHLFLPSKDFFVVATGEHGFELSDIRRPNNAPFPDPDVTNRCRVLLRIRGQEWSTPPISTALNTLHDVSTTTSLKLWSLFITHAETPSPPSNYWTPLYTFPNLRRIGFTFPLNAASLFFNALGDLLKEVSPSECRLPVLNVRTESPSNSLGLHPLLTLILGAGLAWNRRGFRSLPGVRLQLSGLTRSQVVAHRSMLYDIRCLWEIVSLEDPIKRTRYELLDLFPMAELRARWKKDPHSNATKLSARTDMTVTFPKDQALGGQKAEHVNEDHGFEANNRDTGLIQLRAGVMEELLQRVPRVL